MFDLAVCAIVESCNPSVVESQEFCLADFVYGQVAGEVEEELLRLYTFPGHKLWVYLVSRWVALRLDSIAVAC